jgi:hypothetical protein
VLTFLDLNPPSLKWMGRCTTQYGVSSVNYVSTIVPQPPITVSEVYQTPNKTARHHNLRPQSELRLWSRLHYVRTETGLYKSRFPIVRQIWLHKGDTQYGRI